MEKNKKTKFSINTLIKIAMLSVIAMILMKLEFALTFLFPSFLKLDISDIPALLGGLALGPVSGVLIILFKNILKIIVFGTGTAGVGEIANFTVGMFLVFIASFMYDKKKNVKSLILGLVIGTIVMSLAAGILNYYVFIPLYAKGMGAPIDAFVQFAKKVNHNVVDFKTLIYWAIIPFNLLKGLIVSSVYLVLHKSLNPIIQKERIKSKNKISA